MSGQESGGAKNNPQLQRRNKNHEEGSRAFKVKSRRKPKAKKTEFQTASFPPLSFRR
jgi:hypothetical protein